MARRAKGKRPLKVQLPYRCEDCGKIHILVVNREDPRYNYSEAFFFCPNLEWGALMYRLAMSLEKAQCLALADGKWEPPEPPERGEDDGPLTLDQQHEQAWREDRQF